MSPMRLLLSTVAVLLASPLFVLTAPQVMATALTCAQGGACAVGDTGPGGGMVIFAKTSGAFSESFTVDRFCPGIMCQHNTLTAALTADEQAALPFEYIEALDPGVTRAWSANNSTNVGVRATKIGTGGSNTETLVAALPSDTAGDSAVRYAYESTLNGKSDWALASYDELKLFVIRKHALNPSFSGLFLSSTEIDASTAQGVWAQYAQSYPANRVAPGFNFSMVRYFSQSLFTPQLSSVSLSGGSTSGGESVVITGSHLDNVTSVHFGSSPATSFHVDSASQITATAPAGSVGVVDVVVEDAYTQSATLPSAYTYAMPLEPAQSATDSGDESTAIADSSSLTSDRAPASAPTSHSTPVTPASLKKLLPRHMRSTGRTTVIPHRMWTADHARITIAVKFSVPQRLVDTGDIAANRVITTRTGRVIVEIHHAPVNVVVTMHAKRTITSSAVIAVRTYHIR